MAIEQGIHVSNRPRPVNLLEIANKTAAGGAKVNANGGSFSDILSAQLNDADGIRFSKHAQARLHSRGIEMPPESVNRLSQAIKKADSKGSRETLVLSEDAAFVVSVKNRTVITVFDRDNLREGIVTAIDSAVIM